MSSALVGQPQQQPALPAILPQVQAGATTNGASAELNQLLNSTNSLTGDVVNQATQRDLAQKQVEQQKALQQQQQVQVNQLKQQNAMLAQQINALQQQQQQTLNPASLTVPLVNGGVASSNPYLVGLGSLGSYGNPSSSLIFPANQLYSPTFSTAGMGVNTTPTKPAPTTTTSPPTTETATKVSSALTKSSQEDTPLNLVSLGMKNPSTGDDYQLNADAAEAFKKVNELVKKETGEGIDVISAYRSPEHNAAVGGAEGSNHTKGKAIDLNPSAPNYQKSLALLEANGFKSLRGFIYDKPGSGPQDEENHLDFVG